MPSTNRSRTPAGSGDALFDCSKIIKPKDTRPSSRRHLTPVSRVEASSSAPSGGHRPYSSRGRIDREETPSVSNGLRMRGTSSSSKSDKHSSASKTKAKEEVTARPKCLSERRQPVITSRKRSACRKIWNFLRVLILVVAAVGVCAAVIYVVDELPRAVTFCDTDESADGCAPCPEYGECSNGTVRCDEGFEEHRQKCVKDKNLEARAKLWLEKLEHHLAYVHGLAKCYEDETGMLDEYDVKQFLANIYGGTYLEETFSHMKKILPVTIRRTGTVFDTTRVYIPITCRIEHAFWLYVPPIILLMFVMVVIHWLYTYRQRKNEAYALVKQFIENQTTVEPRLSGPTCADVTQYGSSIGIEETQCRAILQRIAQKETSIRSSPDPFRGNALIYWSQRVAATANHLRARGRSPILA